MLSLQAPPSSLIPHPSSLSAGSALVMVMLIMTVLSVVAASLLLTTTMRYHTTFQSASWQEAVVGAEAGVDLAMSELRKRVTQGPAAAFQTPSPTTPGAVWTATNPNKTAFANYGHAFPGNGQPALIGTHGGEGSTALQTRVFVDVPGSGSAPTYATQNFAIPPPDAASSFMSEAENTQRDADGVDRSRWWYRVRALGIAGLAGPPVANLQKMDNRLRRFSFFTDWRTGQAVAAPQTARLVEAIVRPQTNFRNALMADKQINLNSQDVLIDSYDSSKGLYSSTLNHGQMGNIATNGTLINAGNATVDGDAMTNNGSVTGAGNVSGQQSSTFYQELTPVTTAMLDTTWSSVTDDGTITGNKSYTASPSPTSPTVVRLDGISLPKGGNVLKIQAPAGGTAATPAPSYIKIYVQGGISTVADSYINLDPGVNAIVYVTGNVDLQGYGMINNSFLASHLVLDGLQPSANADGTFPSRSINIATNQDFEGVIYAPSHDLTLALNAVPPSGTVPGLTPTVPPANANQINDLQNKIRDAKNDILAKQQDIANQQSQGEDEAALQKIQQDNAIIAQDNTNITSYNAQIAALQGPADNPSQAEDHARGYNGIYGGFVAKTINVAQKTHLHYDETLRQAGPVNHYEITNWFEDNLSRDSVGGAEMFWWPVAAK